MLKQLLEFQKAVYKLAVSMAKQTDWGQEIYVSESDIEGYKIEHYARRVHPDITFVIVYFEDDHSNENHRIELNMKDVEELLG